VTQLSAVVAQSKDLLKTKLGTNQKQQA